MSPVVKVPALRCSQFPFRLSAGAGFLVYVSFFFATPALGVSDLSPWALIVVWAFLLGYIWCSERRPAVWVIQRPDGGLAIHHRHVFWKRAVGVELSSFAPETDVSYETGSWWQAPKLRIGSKTFFLLREAHPAAKALAGVAHEPVYRNINGRV